MSSKRKKYVTVQSNSILYELGNIQGPILHPTWIDLDTIGLLLTNGRVVYEHCITDYHKRLRLTRKNYKDFSMYPENQEIEDPTVAPNTFILQLEDFPADGNVQNMSTASLYVKILD